MFCFTGLSGNRLLRLDYGSLPLLQAQVEPHEACHRKRDAEQLPHIVFHSCFESNLVFLQEFNEKPCGENKYQRQADKNPLDMPALILPVN